MKLALLALVLLLTAAATADGAQCYKKYQFCCFKRVRCGHVVKRVPGARPCPFRKCARVCHPVCHPVKRRVKRSVCSTTLVRVGFRCHGVLHEVGYHPGCKPVFKPHRGCEYKFVHVKSRACKKVCKPVCHVVKARCLFVRIFSYPKFCGKAACSPFQIEGNNRPPKPYVGRKGKLIKTVPGPRKVIH